MVATMTSKPPESLQNKGRSVWQAMQKDYDFGPGELWRLEALCIALDEAELARRKLRAEGEVIDGHLGPKESPWAGILDRATRRAEMLRRGLGLESEDVEEHHEPRKPGRKPFLKAVE